VDYPRVAAELLRTLRGKRSQEAFARRLGVRSHAIYTWESARNFPTAARALWAAERSGIDVGAALARFYTRAPAWLAEIAPTSPAGVARLLDDLRGGSSIVAVARATGHSRFAVARWLKGEAQPRLPEFLGLIEGTSLRLLDFLACLVDPQTLPSVAAAYRDLEATRRAAYDAPWSHAVLRALELRDYRALATHDPGWVAARLGLAAEEETRSLDLLLRSGQVIRDGNGRYAPARVSTVDTRRDPEAARRLRVFWSRVAAERSEHAGESPQITAAYNLFGISHADLQRLRELQRAYFRQMRAIIAESNPVETVVLANMQLIELSADPTARADE
jgi:transcriptional regulator with XRE-family HTH domain